MAYITLKSFEVDKTKTFLENLITSLDIQFGINITNSTLLEVSFDQLLLEIVSSVFTPETSTTRGNTKIRLVSGLDRVTGFVDVHYQKLNIMRYCLLVEDNVMDMGKFENTFEFEASNKIITEEIKNDILDSLRTRFSFGTTGEINYGSSGSSLIELQEPYFSNDEIIVLASFNPNDFWLAETYSAAGNGAFVPNQMKFTFSVSINYQSLTNISDHSSAFLLDGLLSNINEHGAFIASDKDLYVLKDQTGFTSVDHDIEKIKINEVAVGYSRIDTTTKDITQAKDVGGAFTQIPKERL